MYILNSDNNDIIDSDEFHKILFVFQIENFIAEIFRRFDTNWSWGADYFP